jgi:hypothetical protein
MISIFYLIMWAVDLDTIYGLPVELILIFCIIWNDDSRDRKLSKAYRGIYISDSL